MVSMVFVKTFYRKVSMRQHTRLHIRPCDISSNVFSARVGKYYKPGVIIIVGAIFQDTHVCSKRISIQL